MPVSWPGASQTDFGHLGGDHTSSFSLSKFGHNCWRCAGHLQRWDCCLKL
jgi:hypothetical protein